MSFVRIGRSARIAAQVRGAAFSSRRAVKTYGPAVMRRLDMGVRTIPALVAAPTLSTHVLDTATGRPAAGLAVTLYRGSEVVGSATTDADGRIRELATGLAKGTYRLELDLGGYFARGEPAFITRVALDVELGEEDHYHVPLLVSRFGCVSYRGS